MHLLLGLTIPVRVWFAAVRGEKVVVEAVAAGAADVTVESGEIVASAAVLGEGEVAVQV